LIILLLPLLGGSCVLRALIVRVSFGDGRWLRGRTMVSISTWVEVFDAHQLKITCWRIRRQRCVSFAIVPACIRHRGWQ
jgi:hypothetical protein